LIKKRVAIYLIFFLVIIFPITLVNSMKPPSPPEIEVLVNTGFNDELTPERQIVLNKFIRDMSLCGIKLNLLIVNYYEMLDLVLTGDFEIVFFSGIALPNDNMPSILDYLTLIYTVSNYNNSVFGQKIIDMQNAYMNNDNITTLRIFHELELILHEDQFFPTFCYKYNSTDTYPYSTGSFIINCALSSPLQNKSLRWALSYLVNREFYRDTLGYDYVTSHVFGWSQFHDNNLQEIKYSIGLAKSTLAKAGYCPSSI